MRTASKTKTAKKSSKRGERVFSTLHEVNSHFFPKRDERIIDRRGVKKGAETATHAFAGING